MYESPPFVFVWKAYKVLFPFTGNSEATTQKNKAIKTTFIKCLSGEFKFGQKRIRNRNVPTWKFTHNLLHLQIAKKSLVFAD